MISQESVHSSRLTYSLEGQRIYLDWSQLSLTRRIKEKMPSSYGIIQCYWIETNKNSSLDYIIILSETHLQFNPIY